MAKKITFELTDKQIEMLEKYRKIIDPKDKIDLNDYSMLVKELVLQTINTQIPFTAEQIAELSSKMSQAMPNNFSSYMEKVQTLLDDLKIPESGTDLFNELFNAEENNKAKKQEENKQDEQDQKVAKKS